MSQTYRNALLNISADFGADSNAGCFVERHSLDIAPLRLHNVLLSRTWDLLPAGSHHFEWMTRSRAFSRAWIHCERQLARRVLHFTEHELIWECCGTGGTSAASELFPNGIPFKNGLFLDDIKYQVGRTQQGLEVGAEETYATWNDICENLSKKQLTMRSDWPLLLSGLAHDFFQRLPNDEYIGGIWRSTLPHSLLWYSNPRNPTVEEYVAPSWSWLSVGSAVTMANRCQIDKKYLLAKIMQISTTPKYDDPWGPLKNGTLILEGFVRRVRITFDEEGRQFVLTAFVSSGDGTEYPMIIGPSWDSYEGSMCMLRLDTRVSASTDEFECFCLFVTIEQHPNGSQGNERTTICMLLSRNEDPEHTFSRIGILELGDLYSLKMRYEIDTRRRGNMRQTKRNKIRGLGRGLFRRGARPDPNEADIVDESTWQRMQQYVETFQALQLERQEEEKENGTSAASSLKGAIQDNHKSEALAASDLPIESALYRFDYVLITIF